MACKTESRGRGCVNLPRGSRAIPTSLMVKTFLQPERQLYALIDALHDLRGKGFHALGQALPANR